jgi:hypothetical protein
MKAPKLETVKCEVCGGYITANPEDPGPAVAAHYRTIEHRSKCGLHGRQKP